MFVDNDRSANGRWHWLAYGVSLVVAVTMIYSQYTQMPWASHLPAAIPHARAAASPSVAPPAQEPVAAGPNIRNKTEAELIKGSPPLAAWDPHLELPAGRAQEQGLQVNTIWVARAISVLFPQITTIGGYRQDRLRWHPEGLAIDVMIPNYRSPEGIELGNLVAGLALANAGRWGVIHVIWRQIIYEGIDAPSWMADYGNETLNHYDHVHIATSGGGYPTGREHYYVGVTRVSPPG